MRSLVVGLVALMAAFPVGVQAGYCGPTPPPPPSPCEYWVCTSDGWEPFMRPVGYACNDGSACTSNDACNANGLCVGTASCFPPGAFLLQFPLGGSGAVGPNPKLDWSDSSLASDYTLVLTSAGVTVHSVVVTASDYVVPSGVLGPARAYSWQVTARNAHGTTVAQNGPFGFTTAGGPTARLDWSRPDRYGVKSNGVLVDQTSPWGPFVVTLDACGSMRGFAAIQNYTFSTNLTGFAPVTQAQCAYSFSAPLDATFTASVTVRDSAGLSSPATTQVTVRDTLIVALGDSYSSGEGNPDRSRQEGGVIWEDTPCHRSQHSPAAYAALELERADPKSTITFLSAACSGAKVPGVIGRQIPVIEAQLVPSNDSDVHVPITQQCPVGTVAITCGPHPDYVGDVCTCRYPPEPPAAPSRMADVVVLGVGGNDAGFGTLIGECLTHSGCWNYATVKGLVSRARYTLPRLLDQAFGAIRGASFVSDQTKLILTEYPDPTRRSKTEYCTILNFNNGILDEISSGESAFLSSVWATTVNEVLLSAAARNKAAFTAGVWDASIPHGYCSSDPWIRTYYESIATQGGDQDLFGIYELTVDLGFYREVIAYSQGTLHPDIDGVRNIARRVVAAYRGEYTTAVFDSVVGTPVCAGFGSTCWAGPSLIGGVGVTEANAPNALGGTPDGTPPGPTVESLRVTTNDGSVLGAGKWVTVQVDTMIRDPGSEVLVSFTGRPLEGGTYRTTRWTHLATLVPAASGANTFTVQHRLPEGALQGIQVVARGPAAGSFDRDDLLFMVDGYDSCPGTWLQCGMACAHDDVDNCGSCGFVCPSPGPLGGVRCSQDQCVQYCTEPGFEPRGGTCVPIYEAP